MKYLSYHELKNGIPGRVEGQPSNVIGDKKINRENRTVKALEEEDNNLECDMVESRSQWRNSKMEEDTRLERLF